MKLNKFALIIDSIKLDTSSELTKKIEAAVQRFYVNFTTMYVLFEFL